MAVPALSYLVAPLRRKAKADEAEPDFSRVGPLADLSVGQWRRLPVEVVRSNGWEKTRVRRAVWVRRGSGGERDLTVLSPLCPHLGCPVNWQADREQFGCPCHGGVFDASGKVTSGPPPRGLDPLAFEVRGGQLWVRWQDFKIGVSQRLVVDV
jgi:menaquinol-cytochrome c reductase iron-sulfur subunit